MISKQLTTIVSGGLNNDQIRLDYIFWLIRCIWISIVDNVRNE